MTHERAGPKGPRRRANLWGNFEASGGKKDPLRVEIQITLLCGEKGGKGCKPFREGGKSSQCGNETSENEPLGAGLGKGRHPAGEKKKKTTASTEEARKRNPRGLSSRGGGRGDSCEKEERPTGVATWKKRGGKGLVAWIRETRPEQNDIGTGGIKDQCRPLLPRKWGKKEPESEYGE